MLARRSRRQPVVEPGNRVRRVRLVIDFAMARLLGEDSKAAFLYPGALTADLSNI